MEPSTGERKDLIESLCRSFVIYGIPDVLSSDEGPKFTAKIIIFLHALGVHHHQSVGFLHNKCRADIWIKTV